MTIRDGEPGITAVPLGSGARGEVWAAEAESGDWVAMRLLPDSPPGESAWGQRSWSRLVTVRHPHLARVRSVGRMRGRVTLVSDFVEGVDLRARLDREGTLAPEVVARWGAQIAGALAALHEVDEAHGDVRLETVLIDAASGSVRVIDAGVVAPRGCGDIVGLGAVLYELLCGARPFGAIWAQLDVEEGMRPPAPARPDGVPDAVWDVVEACLTGCPTAAEVEWRLRAAARSVRDVPPAPRARERGPRTTVRRRRLVAAAVGAGAGVLLAGGFMAAAAVDATPDPPPPSPTVLEDSPHVVVVPDVRGAQIGPGSP